MPMSIVERQSALERRFPRWEPRTLDQMLEAAVREFPDRPFVVTDEQTFSFRDIELWSRRIAAGLIDAGVRPGNHVGVVLANQPEFVAVKFAISFTGAVSVPINFLNRRDELGYVLRQSDAVLLITMDRFRSLDYLSALDELSPGWEIHGGGEVFPKLKKVVVYPASGEPMRQHVTPLHSLGAGLAYPAAPRSSNPSMPSDIIYTSGTTGSPKGVILTHDMVLRAAYASAYSRAFEDGRRILFALPMYHVYGYIEGLLSVLFVGGAIIPQLKFDAVDTLRAIAQHRATDLLLIPTMTMAVLEALESQHFDLSSLHAVLSSGGRAPAYLWQQIIDRLHPQEITTGYGMTEVTASTTMTRPDDPIERLMTTNGRLRNAGRAGDPALAGKLVDYRVVDPESHQVLASGEVGELVAKGPGVTCGYYNKPEATADAFDADGWLRTGDLGFIDPEGYLTLVGRRKESYRCGGEQVTPSEVEDVLTSHPAVLEAYVVPVPDQRMGEVGVAYVVLRSEASVTPQELLEYTAQRLARFKVPKHVFPVLSEAIPRTPSGRARKFILVQQARTRLNI